MKHVLGSYKNGNYTTIILEDGTKIRQTEYEEFIPEFPENMDVKITQKCSQNCSFCYEGCTNEGKHAKLMNGDKPAQKWMEDLHPYTELALNGNDMDHPELIQFLEYLKSQKVIANITVNQNQFLSNYSKLKELCDKKLIYGIGVSLIRPTQTLLKLIKTIPSIVVHTIVGIVTKDQLEELANEGVKILILGFKHNGRGSSYMDDHLSQVFINARDLKLYLKDIVNVFDVVSFDNLALEQLQVKELLFDNNDEEWNRFYIGDDGTMTYYIDAVEETYSKNSCMSKNERFSSIGLTNKQMFNDIIKRYNNVGRSY